MTIMATTGRVCTCLGAAVVIGVLSIARVCAGMDAPALCEVAASRAAELSGVPLPVLQAIALAESGRSTGGQTRPWPWTVNFGGQGYYYDSSDEAQLAVLERQAAGTTNFDVGCFQINHRWHGAAFPSIAAMFDPDTNARYAADFLQQLFAETGSWPAAAAAYHSRTPEYAERYRARFETLLAGVPGPPEIALMAHRENLFPLLRSGRAGALGSLVPQHPAGMTLIGAAP
jgi:hypothetical protein